MDCAFKLENHVAAYEKILRIAAFNIFAHNRDDHSKKFSFLMDENGNLRLLTILPFPIHHMVFTAQ